ncbi:MAG: hypothetical protein A2622_02695 [Bdellovibrionales bacterium RIFCSPHIGHO2_01_FULL_40_29]|nr:MAG: hypothetical protein A2622_02695 [Bdellovibrionales bacterium RIFCSPHIGHO2_01_FULL_40_29]OFZ33987.1 MAG: hypothetical protein A3D17_03115 [Bdellovibrionales bacterium RIFCSPHIGHO2_02_FULL_40_15]
MKIHSLILMTVLFFGCSQNLTSKMTTSQTQKSSIINGTPVTADNSLGKSVVGLFMKSDSDEAWFQSCTGSVLTSKFILTAAHCVNGLDAGNILVHFSLNTMTSENQANPAKRIHDVEAKFVTRRVKAFMIHPDYRGVGDYDLALLMLEENTPKTAIPVQLLPDQYLNRDEAKTTLEGQRHQVKLMGFGLVSEDPVVETEMMRETVVSSHFIDHFVVTDQTQGSGGCNGDSGGPAFLTLGKETYQVGVTHGPHGRSRSCSEQGEWFNPALDQGFLKKAQQMMSGASSAQVLK